MRQYINQAIVPLGLVIFVFLVLLAFPWSKINWGTIKYAQQSSVTVTGMAEKQETNQKATFNLGVMAVNSNKDAAVAEVNQKTQQIVDFVKKFGIPAEDIKTQNLSIYQEERSQTDGGLQKFVKGDWRANSNIDVTIKDASKEKVSEFADAAAKTPATNVYGPNYSVDSNKASEAEGDLMGKAVENARAKAQKVAEANGMSVGKVLNVVEGGVGSGIMPMFDKAMGMGGGAGAPIEPGSSTLSKSVTVTFELK